MACMRLCARTVRIAGSVNLVWVVRTESGAVGFFCTGAGQFFERPLAIKSRGAFLVNTAAWRNVLVEPAQELTRVRVIGFSF